METQAYDRHSRKNKVGVRRLTHVLLSQLVASVVTRFGFGFGQGVWLLASPFDACTKRDMGNTLLIAD
jgi:hypothetical protein